ncbi:MAG: trypsin-like peptidase domain-containing protein [Phycisphaerales bacterium]
MTQQAHKLVRNPGGAPAWCAAWLLCCALCAAPACAQGEPDFTPDDSGAPSLESGAPQPDSPEAFRAFEDKVRATARTAQQTVVALLLRHGDMPGSGSGVIISPDGWILTAGHVGLVPDVDTLVVLADGTKLRGKTVGQLLDQDQDVGLVKVDTGGRALPFAELGSATKLRPGDPLLVFGHPLGPEMEPWRPPPLRVGQVVVRRGTVLVMDAPVSPGDSGGPVFDLAGKVVGINSVASSWPDLNAAITVDLAKDKMEELRKPQRLGAMQVDITQGIPPAVDMEVAFQRDIGAAHRDRKKAVRNAVAPLLGTVVDSVVMVLVDARPAALGVVVDKAGHILTKASEVGVGPRVIQVALPDGLMVRATRIAQDTRHDLMLLGTGAEDLDPVVFSDAEPGFADAILSVGQGLEPAAVGFRSLGAYDAGASDQASRSLLGVGLKPARGSAGGSVEIAAVMENSGAQEAGLQVGDVLLRVDGTPMVSPDSAAAPLRQRAPGDVVEVEYMRGTAKRKAKVRLQRFLMERGPGNVGAELSRRSTGFGPVIQHDGIVPAEAMGAPILDTQGRVVGLNIARADRAKTYALRSTTVKEALAELLKAAARGDSAEPADPRTALKHKTFGADGVAVLGAWDAQVIGPTVTLQGDDASLAIEGWASPEDVAVWVVDFPAPGTYDLALVAAGMAGGRVDIYADAELFTVNVPRAQGPSDFGTFRANEVVIDEAGPRVVRVQPLERPHAPIMRLRQVEIRRLDLIRLVERALPYMKLRDPERLRREAQREAQRERARKANEAPPTEPKPADAAPAEAPEAGEEP